MAAIITTHVEGVSVTGRILERTASTLEVELLHPFGRLTDGRSIMALAQRYVTYQGQHGDESARAILTNLYGVSAFVNEHLDELRGRWAETRKQLDERCGLVVRSRAEYAEERAKARRRFRDGETDSDDHQRWMITLSNDFEELSFLVADAVDALFAECGIELSYNVQAQLMRRVDPSFDMPHEAAYEGRQGENVAMPTYEDLRGAAAEVGRALARARGLDPNGWFKGLPAYLSVLPYQLLRLFAEDEALWTAVASHHGLSLAEWQDEVLDMFEPTRLGAKVDGA